MASKVVNISYNPSQTIRDFHAFIQEYWVEKNLPVFTGILGPPGSGKSVGVTQALEWVYSNVDPDENGIRHSKIALVRVTIREIREAFHPPLQKWFPPYSFGKMANAGDNSPAPLAGEFEMPHITYHTDGTVTKDGTTCKIKLQGYPFQDDIATAIEQLKSTEWTAAYLNELFSLPPEAVGAFIERTGRYPTAVGRRTRAKLVLADYNMPPEGNWACDLPEKNGTYYFLGDGSDGLQFAKEGEHVPEEATIAYIQKIFVQPPGLLKKPDEYYEDGVVKSYKYTINPEAEVPPVFTPAVYLTNLSFLLSRGQFNKIDRELCMLKVADSNKKPVYQDIYVREQIVVDHDYPPHPLRETIAGTDTSGINPCVIYLQKIPEGWLATSEFYYAGMPFNNFVYEQERITVEDGNINASYSKAMTVFSCDPANASGSETGSTPVETLTRAGFIAVRALGRNTHSERKNALSMCLLYNRFGDVKTDQARGVHPMQIYISKNCPMLIHALEAGHVYKKVKGADEGIYHVQPNKDTIYSHYVDALEYGALEIVKRTVYLKPMDSELDKVGVGLVSAKG